MAENNTYHIYLHLGELSDKKNPVAGTGNGSTGDGSKDDNENDGTKLVGDFVMDKAKKLVSFAAVKSTADQIINYEISQVSLRTGANEYEQRLSARQSIISSSVGAGAALIAGGVVGGIGGLAVASLGVAVSAMQKLIGVAQNQNTLNTERNLEDIALSFANVRAGAGSRRSAEQ